MSKIMKCPKCKGLNFKKVYSKVVNGNPYYGRNNWYRCKDCGKEWHNHE